MAVVSLWSHCVCVCSRAASPLVSFSHRGVCVLSLIMCAEIPEDPQAADVYYDQDGFESCSEDEEPASPAETLYLSDPQVSAAV